MLILFLQFRSLGTTIMVFSAILVAWSGSFLMIWLYGQAGSWIFSSLIPNTGVRTLHTKNAGTRHKVFLVESPSYQERRPTCLSKFN
ncbi:MAG: hypothetical protein D3923_14175 [Candidatus Electrothrix sp. AR3]|nr:hypothetical protein [Candidatus Electrothrix sp. AR3]